MGKNDIEISIRNCRNITKLKDDPLLIRKNRLNVFFGANGTGKTTICKVLQYLDDKDEHKMEELVPYGTEASAPKPCLKRSNFRDKTLVFNSQWIGDHCFKGSDLQDGAYDLYIENDETRKLESKRDALLSEVKGIIESAEFSELLRKAAEIKKGLGGVTKDGAFSASSPVAKAYENGSPVDKGLPSRLESVVNGMSYGVKAQWIKWHKGAPSCSSDALCPYCGAFDRGAMEECRNYDRTRSDKAIGGWAKMVDMFQLNSSLLTVEGRTALNAVLASPKKPSEEEFGNLADFRRKVETFEQTLNRITYLVSTEDEPAELVSRLSTVPSALEENRVFLKTRKGMMTDEQRVLTRLMRAIERVKGESDKLKKVTRDLKDHMSAAIEGKEQELDAFLNMCGYRYHIEISSSIANREAHIRLMPDACEQHVANPGSSLSYGEKNALSLALFMFEALSEPRALVVLDDPISSFDYDKRYGVLHALFGRSTCFKKNLRDRTVLLLTHDYLVVQDLIALPGQGGPATCGRFLSTTKDGILVSEPLQKESIAPYGQILLSKIEESKGKDDLIRLVYVRQLCEIRRKNSRDKKTSEGVTFSLLSDVIHGRDIGLIQKKIAEGEITQYAINTCNSYVRKVLGTSFNYIDAIGKYADNTQLVKMYDSADRTPEEKLVLARLMIERNRNLGKGEPAMRRFANESCHIGGNYLYQLRGVQYAQVPFYVEEWCDRIAKEAADALLQSQV